MEKAFRPALYIGAQQIVEKYVNGFKEAMGAKNIGVIVENPSTGEIIAMDGGDRYDLNNPRDLSNVYSQSEIDAMNDEETVDALNGMWSNFCVTDAYEPGSVVKPIVMGSALEMGAISESDNFAVTADSLLERKVRLLSSNVRYGRMLTGQKLFPMSLPIPATMV